MLLHNKRCVSCPAFPTCPECKDGTECIILVNTCDKCAEAICRPLPGSGSKSGPNAGAIAGGVVGAFVLLAIVAGVFWYRRRQAFTALLARKRTAVEVKKDVIANPHDVLNRPDPIEKPKSLEFSSENQPAIRVFYSDAIDLNPHSPQNSKNPFDDDASIVTASDRATNVIPIAYMPPSSASAITTDTSLTSDAPTSIAPSTITPPARPISTEPPSAPRVPQRGPEIDMRLEASRPVSDISTLAPPKAPYAPSAISGISGVSSRASTISTTSSFLNEAPQIVTPLQAGFRQVLGVHKAEVVHLQAPSDSSGTPRSSRTTQGSSLAPSPLARNFTAGDLQNGDGDEDPFADNASERSTALLTPTSTVTFGTRTLSTDSAPPGWDESRPSSMMSGHATVISNATRVQVTRSNTISTTRTPASTVPPTPRHGDFRSPGQLSPPAQGVPKSFDDLRDARMSQSSFATSHRTSTADSILESFPFVPPSPISMAHNGSSPGTPKSPRDFQQQQAAAYNDNEPLRPPPSRATLGMSVVSSMSTNSNGLGAFPFQFGANTQSETPAPRSAPSSTAGRASRASLDTLALSQDVNAFPIVYDDSPTTPTSSMPFKKSS